MINYIYDFDYGTKNCCGLHRLPWINNKNYPEYVEGFEIEEVLMPFDTVQPPKIQIRRNPYQVFDEEKYKRDPDEVLLPPNPLSEKKEIIERMIFE